LKPPFEAVFLFLAFSSASFSFFDAFRSVPFRSVPFRSVPFRSVPFRSVPFRSVPFRSAPFRSVPAFSSRRAPFFPFREKRSVGGGRAPKKIAYNKENNGGRRNAVDAASNAPRFRPKPRTRRPNGENTRFR